MKLRNLVPLAVIFAVLSLAAVAYAAFIAGPIGEQPTVTPRLDVSRPFLFRAGQPVTVKVAYRDFDLEPQLRCGPAGPCTGSLPQSTQEGRDVGHIHVYLQRVSGPFPAALATSFCIPATKVADPNDPYSGTVSGVCPAVPAGLYRVTAEAQSNSHIAALRANPQDAPATDTTFALAR